MFYDVTALSPAPSMFHNCTSVDIASLKNAPQTAQVHLNPSDTKAVFAYFMHSDRSEAIRDEVSAQLRSFQTLRLVYIFAYGAKGLAFGTEPPPAQWLPGCCIYLDKLVSQEFDAKSKVLEKGYIPHQVQPGIAKPSVCGTEVSRCRMKRCVEIPIIKIVSIVRHNMGRMLVQAPYSHPQFQSFDSKDGDEQDILFLSTRS